jgi:hypothetical protein
MHKAESFIKCRHYKSVHGGTSLFILEGVEANPTVHPRNDDDDQVMADLQVNNHDQGSKFWISSQFEEPGPSHIYN